MSTERTIPVYQLTNNRLEKVMTFLERHRSSLVSTGAMDTHQFEDDLKRLLKLNYKQVKDILIDIVNRYPRYRYLALYFMQYCNPTGPVMEFRSTIARAYGLEFFTPDEVDARSKEFWQEAVQKMKNDDSEPQSYFWRQ